MEASTIIIEAGTLEFNEDTRSFTGLLLPYGEECNSNLGKFSVDKGVISIPEETMGMSLNVEHTRENVVGAPTKIWEQDEGVFGTFGIAKGVAGDKAIADIKSGARKKLSAEVANMVIRNGKALAGKLFAASLVKDGAFPSATLLASLNEGLAMDEETQGPPPVTDSKSETTDTSIITDSDGTRYRVERKSEYVTTETRTKVDNDGVELTEDATQTEDTNQGDTTVSETETLNAAKVPAGARTISRQADTSLATLYAALERKDRKAVAELAAPQGGNTLFAAAYAPLADITASEHMDNIGQPQFLGDIYNKRTYVQKNNPLFGTGILTSDKVAGYRMTTGPEVRSWAGDKTAVHTNEWVTVPVEDTADRFAGAWDLDRSYFDFGKTSFIDAAFKRATDDYLKQIDLNTGAVILAAAGTAITSDGDPFGNNNRVAAAILDGALALIANDHVATFAKVALNLWRELALFPKNDISAYLELALGLEEGSFDKFKIIPDPTLANNKVLVGAKEAATIYGLPGAAPIRVDGLDIAHGGVDVGLYGYHLAFINDASALKLVTAAPFVTPTP